MLILVLPELFLSQNSCSGSSCQPLQNIWKLPMIVPKISCNSFTILSESLFLNFAMWSVTWPSEGPGFLFKQISILCHILPLNCLHYCFLFFGKIIWFEKKKGGGRGPSPLQQKSGKRMLVTLSPGSLLCFGQGGCGSLQKSGFQDLCPLCFTHLFLLLSLCFASRGWSNLDFS